MSELFSAVRRYIKRPAAKNTGALFVYGTVISISPLQIKFDNNQVVDDDFIILSCLCKEAVIEIPFRYQGEIGHLHQGVHGPTSVEMPEIMLWRGLESGDRVRAISVNGGQQYYVIEREEGIV